MSFLLDDSIDGLLTLAGFGTGSDQILQPLELGITVKRCRAHVVGVGGFKLHQEIRVEISSKLGNNIQREAWVSPKGFHAEFKLVCVR